MTISVSFYQDAAAFSAAAGAFLRSRPVYHNLLLTLLDARLTRPEPGRYWLAARDGQVVGVVFQSPLDRSPVLAPMDLEIVEALVEAIADAGTVLPGVSGDAATAAGFAGRWTERCKTGATPFCGLRIYELAALNQIAPVEGHLRQAEEADRKLAEVWAREFGIETHSPPGDPARQVDAWLTARQIWLWQDGGVVSMAVTRGPAEGVVRIGPVYTPPELRRRGYAAACVHGLSKHLIQLGLHCILYTDLGNPTSNSIYRRIGYRAVSEGLHYRFDPS